jgi:predicted SAM-dependent methyltransferase
MKSYLNLGCGNKFHPNWTNVDLIARGNSVIGHDLRKGIPFSDGEFDLVYHSHLLEHFPRAKALPFLRECYRVLKHGGTIRVAVPDLERIARAYLQALTEAVQGVEKGEHNYEWIMLELYDQTVRERSGGAMATYLNKDLIPNEKFVLKRIGIEGQRIIENAKRTRRKNPTKMTCYENAIFALRRFLHFLARTPLFFREYIIRLALGSNYELLKLGRFRRCGEIHLWMYDRYSLTQLLQEAGFHGPQLAKPDKSYIHGWTNYHLDTEADGTICKPDSIYMEALKS